MEKYITGRNISRLNIDYDSFYNNSCLKLEKVVEKEKINNCIETFIEICKLYYPNEFSKFKSDCINDQDFHSEIKCFRDRDRVSFGKLYDTLQSSLAIKSLATSKRVKEIASSLLNVQEACLMIRNTIIRIDIPGDKRNLVNWHYDAYIDSQSHIPTGGLTIIIPFTGFTLENGAPELCIGSHKTPPKQSINKSKDENGSEIYSIPESYLRNYKKSRLIANAGDLIAFPMTTVHKSCTNFSNQVRICALLRYYSYTNKDYLPIRETFTPII